MIQTERQNPKYPVTIKEVESAVQKISTYKTPESTDFIGDLSSADSQGSG